MRLQHISLLPMAGLRLVTGDRGREELVTLTFRAETDNDTSPRPSASRPAAPLRRGVRLTRTEKEIVGDIVQGRSNVEIAQSRQRSVHTVANHVSTILRKLSVGSRRELAEHVEAAPDPRSA
jgi:DNA-binding CsgD family transcriptional regulator